MERLACILEAGDDDIALKAIGELRQMEAQNQKDEHKFADIIAVQQQHARVDAIANELGVDQRLILDATATSGGSVEGVAKPPAKKAGRKKQGRRKKA
jgi:hypothetical protein